MAATKNLEPAFHGVGQKPGTQIWRIENFQPVPYPKSEYGRFYSGDSYIVLQDEAGTAAIKTVELDAVLGGRAVQHREIQNHESDKFLSYFKPCIIPLEGGVATGFKKPEEEEFETRLYTCKGKRVVHLKQVPFSRSVLNHDDVFILDTKDKIFQFNGANSNIQERAKALEVIQFLKDKYHDGTCNVAIVDDGKLQAEGDSGEFWVIFGGFAPIGKKVASEDDIIPDRTPAKLYNIAGGEVKDQIEEITKSALENDKCYLMDSLLKQQGVGQKGQPKVVAPVVEEVPPLLEGNGKLEVWSIDGGAKNPIASEDIGKFYSGDCYIVLYTYHSREKKEDFYLCYWIGKDSTEGRIYQDKEPPQLIAIFQPMVVFKPGIAVKYQKEGTESASFWLPLGGKQNFKSTKVSLETFRDPHLFAFSLIQGKFEIEEVYNFDQDDLLPEDILILDTHAEKYIEWAGSLDGLSPRVPLYKVTEGNEPCFFTTYFAWEPAKSLIHGNAFEKKVVMLFGAGHAAAEGNQGGGPTQRASAMAALNSAFKPGGGGKGPGSPKGPSQGSQRRAAVAALSSVLTDEKKKSAEPSPVGSPEAPEAEAEAAEEASEPAPEAIEDDSEPKVAIEEDENGILTSQSTFTYEQVRVKSENPVPGIDLKRREAYLSVEEFESVLGMSREEFYQLPKWKQDNTKKKVDLF
ncbi:Gelsolin domain-containing protein [Cynara cardunculus var. scolymus]|uniref:Gelsolin domain-containing protein n=1 Tax=Cynara cardunculus var. scolymus TaxID=59895 RepID=A0A103Y6N2_CYNCS|nr:Gelsolin domain-containing protein [Cynara cardunculus var. scolymus]